MQQKLSVRNLPLCREIRELPSSRGERERFRSLSSLRTHLDYGHAYHTLHDLGPGSRWRTAAGTPLPPDGRRAREGSCTESCKSARVEEEEETRHPGDDNAAAAAAVEKGRLKHGAGEAMAKEEQGEEPEAEPAGVGEEKGEGAVAVGAEPGAEPAGVGEEKRGGAVAVGAEPGARLRRRLQDMLRATDSTVERRLLTVSTELERADSELLRHRARSQHLAQVKQELCQRERALSRQVDSAVMVIATLRQQLCVSQQELERKEQEVITIHHFLETAVQHEMCGKVRLQNFIENLLQRISLAERLLKYYQSTSTQPNCTAHCPHSPVSEAVQKICLYNYRSAAGLLTSDDPTETRGPSDRKGRPFMKSQRESLGHSPDYKGEETGQRRQFAHYEA